MLHVAAVDERVVIGEDGELQIAVKIRPPMLTRVVNSEKFLLARVVVDLGGDQLPRPECDWLQTSALVLL